MFWADDNSCSTPNTSLTQSGAKWLHIRSPHPTFVHLQKTSTLTLHEVVTATSRWVLADDLMNRKRQLSKPRHSTFLIEDCICRRRIAETSSHHPASSRVGASEQRSTRDREDWHREVHAMCSICMDQTQGPRDSGTDFLRERFMVKVHHNTAHQKLQTCLCAIESSL